LDRARSASDRRSPLRLRPRGAGPFTLGPFVATAPRGSVSEIDQPQHCWHRAPGPAVAIALAAPQRLGEHGAGAVAMWHPPKGLTGEVGPCTGDNDARLAFPPVSLRGRLNKPPPWSNTSDQNGPGREDYLTYYVPAIVRCQIVQSVAVGTAFRDAGTPYFRVAHASTLF